MQLSNLRTCHYIHAYLLCVHVCVHALFVFRLAEEEVGVVFKGLGSVSWCG